MVIDVVIPALNEEKAIGCVIRDLPRELIRDVVVSDNGSTDETRRCAEELGAKVVCEARRGYGAACLRAIHELRRSPPNVVVFLDGDYSDFPEELPTLLAPIAEGRVIDGLFS